ncbi:MAG: M10 family metallopeptidase C-terminal domain-containing protein [Pseudomonadota bacterium]
MLASVTQSSAGALSAGTPPPSISFREVIASARLSVETLPTPLSRLAERIAQTPPAVVFEILEHIEDARCCCLGCLRAEALPGPGSQIAALPENSITEAIDWGGQAVSSGAFNVEGDMIIEYYFEPAVGNFQFFFERLAWTDYEENQVREAFDYYETLINVEFVETNNSADAEFRLNKVDSNVPIVGGFLGFMNPPQEAGAGSAAFAGQPGAAGWTDEAGGGLEQGGFGWITIVHEFGHGLGLAHPHDVGGGSSILPGVDGDPQTDTGDFDLNQGVYTMMSYVDGWALNPDGAPGRNDWVDYGYIAGPMALDIALLQDKYGANTETAAGDDLYILPDVNGAGTFFTSIWDAGGTDELRYEGFSDATLDLRAATLLLEEGGGGWVSTASGIYGGYTIANDVVIENATGGWGSDLITENAADNMLTGWFGADTFVFVEEGGGIDTITDFVNGVDMVDLSDLGPIRRRDVTFSQEENGVSLTVFDHTIVFEGVSFSDFTRDDFILA